MIIPGVNLLVYAYSKRSLLHDAAARWWTAAVNGAEDIGIAAAVALGFVRLMSNAKVVDVPLRPEVLLRTVESWLDLPRVRLVGPGFRHFEAMAVVHTNDSDFVRFPSVRTYNPL